MKRALTRLGWATATTGILAGASYLLITTQGNSQFPVAFSWWGFLIVTVIAWIVFMISA